MAEKAVQHTKHCYRICWLQAPCSMPAAICLQLSMRSHKCLQVHYNSVLPAVEALPVPPHKEKTLGSRRLHKLLH